MLYCENCRQTKALRRPPTFPFHKLYRAKCEICERLSDCYDYPALFAKPDTQKTNDEKILDRRAQLEYKQKAETLEIRRAVGVHAGSLDQVRNEELKKVFLYDSRYEDNIDWYGTYEMRLLVQEGYNKAERGQS